MALGRQSASTASDFDLLTADQVAAITGIAASSLHLYAARREAGLSPVAGPPHVRLGPRKRRWLRTDVLAWIESCRITDGPE
jgi:predicted DNA-binding transcriptional regulator AlpA